MTTIRLNDLQLIMLSAASQRENASLMPLPEAAVGDAPRTEKAIAALRRKGLVAEQPVADRRFAWREEDGAPVGLFVTAAGRAAIGIDAGEGASVADGESVEASPSPGSPTRSPRVSKTALVLDLLARVEGATLAELMAATGWLPHTTRAALTGLRKKGHGIVREAHEGASRYRIVETA